MSTLAVIVTAYAERGAKALPGILRALDRSTRRPDEVWLMTEDIPPEPGLIDLPTPRDEDGRYAVIPYSLKINFALDRVTTDYVGYVTDDSLPDEHKYERLVAALDANPEWGVVFSSQLRNGAVVNAANRVVADAVCVVDHTQVVHRRSEDRWPLDVGEIRMGDAAFWRSLHARFGSFYGVGDALDIVNQTPEGISATY